MQLLWKSEDQSGAIDPVTDYRLRQSASQTGAQASDLWWSALLQLDSGTVAALDAALGAAFAGRYVIPAEHLEDAADPDLSDPDLIVTIYAKPDVMTALNLSGNDYGVKTVDLGAQVSDATVTAGSALPDPEDEIAPASLKVKVVDPGTVTVAVIDDGIAFGHNLFRDGLTSSRVEGMFIMDAPKPNGSGVGRKFNRRQINALLLKHTHNGLLDDEAFYTDAGSIDFSSPYFSTTMFRRAHGTHVMSLAAGYPMEQAHAKRPIIAVQLPSKVTEDTSGTNLAPSLQKAIRYILRRSKQIRIGAPDGPIAPLVVNFSYGNFAGPHDGTSLIARMLDRELASTPEQEIRVLLPAGNSNMAQVHAAVSFENADAVSLDLNVMPDDLSSNYVQMWMPFAPATPPDFVQVRVTPPHAPQSMVVQAIAGSKQVLHDAQGNVVAELGYSFEPMPTARGVITLAVNPTASHDPAVHLAPSGRWTIELTKGVIDPDDIVEVRIKRDERLPGYPNGARQSYFDNACYVKVNEIGMPMPVDPAGSDCPIKRAGTLSGFACGKVPIVVGGLTQSNGQLAVYSSAGPISKVRGKPNANREGPDASARSDDSLVQIGVMGAGTRSGSMVRMNGTSVAAPLVARMVADGLEAGETADRAWVEAAAQASDSSYPPLDPPNPFATRTGGGRLRLPNPF